MDSILYFLIGFLIMSGIYSVFSVGLNIHWGHTGLFNIGIASFFLLGSYTAAIISSPSPNIEKYEEYLSKDEEEFSELASGVLASSFVHGEPVSSVTAIVILAHRYSNTKNLTELRNLKWGIIKGSLSIGTFALTIKSMGVSLLSFLVGLCVVAVVRKTVSNLRFFEYIKFLRSLKTKIPNLKKKISRREFISFKIFEFKKA